ncbi:MAG: SpoIIE family protein phosphatase [Lachnospiraceae bacterium]|nr:SpoIIE family protein phosphatase [Lachnospiraceae bacterium]
MAEILTDVEDPFENIGIKMIAAAAENDEKAIMEWMQSKPNYLGRLSEGDGSGEIIGGELIPFSLYSDYLSLSEYLRYMKQLFGLASAYIEYDRDNLTYTLVNSGGSLLSVGASEKSVDAFARFEDNAAVSPTVFKEGGKWLCATCEPLMGAGGTEDEGKPVCLVGVDIEMTEIIRERHRFLNECMIFVLLLSAFNIFGGIRLMSRSVTERIRKLASAASAFTDEESGYSRDAEVPPDSVANDEIGDLYDEIRSMQNRILDYMDDLTRITAQEERMNTELALAAKIQQDALPPADPAFPGRTEFALHAAMTPARLVGGDFYDYFLIDETHLALVIADVSDKGVPAALFMMSAKNLIHYRAKEGGTPHEILDSVNRQLTKNNKQRMFVTVWLGILDLTSGEMTCTNAGHMYPVIRGQDGIFRLLKDRHGLVLGVLDRTGCQDYVIRLHAGDIVFVYTDGLTEANDIDGKEYGEKRLVETLNRIGRNEPEEILEEVRKDVCRFSEGTEQFDDLTMLCLEYK